MSHNLRRSHFGADEHPCTTYVDVHQGFPGFLTEVPEPSPKGELRGSPEGTWRRRCPFRTLGRGSSFRQREGCRFRGGGGATSNQAVRAETTLFDVWYTNNAHPSANCPMIPKPEIRSRPTSWRSLVLVSSPSNRKIMWGPQNRGPLQWLVPFWFALESQPQGCPPF